ncbi:hypothetical protein BKA70DRAFT_1233925 [Coprinopsis sp. MPI-PUGE-AT-0042]|nr:hypothetical protein BKA70DRAFT_1233925 [Coprinopsis sp. MPI-PUGE-AT-0042]
MVHVSTLLPVELMCCICEELGMADLLAVTRCSQLGRALGDYELWRRLAHVVSPFLHLSDALLLNFFRLLEATGLAVLGGVALDLLLFGSAVIPGPTDEVKTLELAVNHHSFPSTIEFFKDAGYTFTITWRDDFKEPEPENVLGKAVGSFDKAGCTYQVKIVATLNSPFEYIVKLSSTHLMNAITRSGIYCLYPGLTLIRKGLTMGNSTPTHGMQLENINRHWTRGQCRRYCPRKSRNASNDPGILAYRWLRSLDRSGEYNACQTNPYDSLAEVGRLCSSYGFLDVYTWPKRRRGLKDGITGAWKACMRGLRRTYYFTMHIIDTKDPYGEGKTIFDLSAGRRISDGSVPFPSGMTPMAQQPEPLQRQ